MRQKLFAWSLIASLLFGQMTALAAELPVETETLPAVEAVIEAAESSEAIETAAVETETETVEIPETDSEETSEAETSEMETDVRETDAEETEVEETESVEQLPTCTAVPTDLRWDGDILQWNPVEGAVSYICSIVCTDVTYTDTKERVLETSEPSVDLTEALAELAADYYAACGERTVEVKVLVCPVLADALDANTGLVTEILTAESPLHAATLVEPKIPANVRWENNKLLWDAVEQCTGYEVILYVGSVEKDVLYVAEPSCDTTELLKWYCGMYARETGRTSASVVARVRALYAGIEPGEYGRSTTLQYDLKGFKVLAKPTGLKWEDFILRWTAVTGADQYELYLTAGSMAEKCFTRLDLTGTSADLTDTVPELVERYHQATGKVDVPVTAYLCAVNGENDLVVDSYYQTAPVLKTTFPCKRERNTIECKDLSLEAAAKKRTLQLQVSAQGGAALSYKSSNTKIKVSSAGKITIPAKFTGTATITVTSAPAGNYVKTEQSMVVKVNPAITAKDMTVSSSASEKTYSLGAKVVGTKATLSYSCEDKRITVTGDGKVRVPAHFADTVSIRIDASCAAGTASSRVIQFKVTPLIENTMTVKDRFVRVYSPKAQSFTLGAVAGGSAKLTYQSDNSKVKVNSKGKVTVAKGFRGTATLTIRSAETGVYYAAEKKVQVDVVRAENAITVKNVTKMASVKAQNISLKAKVLGKAPLTYRIASSSMEGAAVSEKGVVFVPAGFMGDIVVHIDAAECYGYNAASKDVQITISPVAPSLTLTNSLTETVSITYGNSLKADHYILQIGTNKSFAAGTYEERTVKAGAAAEPYGPAEKGKTYYARIRTVTASGQMSAWSSVKTVKITK